MLWLSLSALGRIRSVLACAAPRHKMLSVAVLSDEGLRQKKVACAAHAFPAQRRGAAIQDVTQRASMRT